MYSNIKNIVIKKINYKEVRALTFLTVQCSKRIMKFVGKAIREAKKAVANISESANSAKETISNKISYFEKESELSELYEKLGKMVVEFGMDSPSVLSLIEEAKTKKAEFDSLTKKPEIPEDKE